MVTKIGTLGLGAGGWGLAKNNSRDSRLSKISLIKIKSIKPLFSGLLGGPCGLE